MIELKDMSLAELAAMRDEIDKLIAIQKKARQTQLVMTLLDAAKALRAEFPWISANVDVEVEDFVYDIDLLDYLLTLEPHHFKS